MEETIYSTDPLDLGMDGRNIPRRRVLNALGSGTVAATAGLAGCLGGGENGSDDDEPADGNGNGNDDGNENGDEDGTGEQSERLEEVNITVPASFDPADPHDSTLISMSSVSMHAYEGLLARSGSGELQSRLATDWERIEPGQFRFELRDDVVFHNGNEFTADDVAYSIHRIIDDDVSIQSPRSDTLGGIVDVDIVDDYTVDVISDGLNTSIESAFASYLGLIVQDEEWVEENDEEYVASHMNGTGPFELVEFDEDEIAVFEPFEDYWGDDPLDVERVSITFTGESSTRVNQLLAGEAHIVESVGPEDIPNVQDDENVRIETAPSSRVMALFMDTRQDPWSSREFREAINYAIDVEGYIDNIMNGFAEVSTQPILPEMFGYDPDIEPWPYDPERAEELIDESGHDGVELELTIGTGRYILGVEIANAIAGNIDELPNVSCEVNPIDWSTFSTQYMDTQPEEMDFFFVGYGHPSFDGTQTIGEFVINRRRSRYFEDGIDEIESLYEESFETEDDDDREALLQEASRTLVDDAGWGFLHQQHSIVGVSDLLEWEMRNDELMTVLDASHAN